MKPLLVIVEGPDRCGKGSFIEVLRNKIDTPKQLVIHSGKPPSISDNPKLWSYDYNSNLISNIDILSKSNDVIILDRSYLGEYIYGKLYRHIDYTHDDFIEFENTHIKHLLNTIYVVLVNFTDSVNNVFNRDDGKSHITSFDSKFIEHKKFKRLHHLSLIENKYMIDWSITTFSDKNLNFLSSTILNTWRNQ